MGIIRQGILGGFRNKTGTVVGAPWRTLDVIRGLPRKSSKPPTQLQLNQQQKWGLVTGILSWISVLIDIGFKSVTKISSPMNVAVQYHLREAIAGAAPNFTFDYTKLRFSVGKLMLPNDITVAGVAVGKLDFTWAHNEPDDKNIDATDMLSVLVYNPVKDKFLRVSNVAPRSAKAYSMILPNDFSGDTCHVYLAFNSVVKKGLTSDSDYLGSLPVL